LAKGGDRIGHRKNKANNSMTQKLEFSKFLGQETEDEITQVSTYATFQIRLTTISTNLL